MDAAGLRRRSTALLLHAAELRQQADEARLRAAERLEYAKARKAALQRMRAMSAPAMDPDRQKD